MPSPKEIISVLVCLPTLFALISPSAASADIAPRDMSSVAISEHKLQNAATRDFVLYNRDTNMLRVCDNSPRNGTATGYLIVVGGNYWTLIDRNGEQDPCANAGPLHMDESKDAYLALCTSPGVGCENLPYTFKP